MNAILCVVSVLTDVRLCLLHFAKCHFENVLNRHFVSPFMLALPNYGIE